MSDDKKIIIDEDWKSQVAAEKEAAQQQRQSTTGEGAAASGAGGGQEGYIPIEPSFELLISTFVTEAMVALGQLPHPATNQPMFDPAHAQFAIGMLEVIADKTKGNLIADEDRALQDVLHQLRMAYVTLSNQLAAMSNAEDSSSGSPSPIITG